MPTATRQLCLTALLVLVVASLARAATATTPSATTTQPYVSMPAMRSLIVHGTSGAQAGGFPQVWAARIVKDKSNPADYVTHLSYREARGTGDWTLIEPTPARTVALTHDGAKVVMLLASGDYIWVRESSGNGPPLPAGAAIRAMAGGATRLWALGDVDPSKVSHAPAAPEPTSSSRPSTTPTIAPATRPTTLVLFARHDDRWDTFAIWPGDWPLPAGDMISMVAWERSGASTRPAPTTGAAAPADRQILVAYCSGDNVIRIVRLRPQIELIAGLVPPRPVRDFKLITTDAEVRLWTLDDQGQMQLWDFTDSKLDASPLKFTGHTLVPGEADITSAGDQLRLFYLAGEKTFEQDYSPVDLSAGRSQEVTFARGSAMDKPLNWIYIVALGVLTFILVSSMRRQRAAQQHIPRVLAGGWLIVPMGQRLLAGAIDAIPIFVMLIAAGRYIVDKQIDPATVGMFNDAYLRKLFMIGSAAYIGHTLLLELLLARSLGKLIVGLRVIGPDGQKPTPGAILIRNLLRIIDLPAVAFGLILDLAIMLYSPLRQRLGDVVAGTLVVRKTDLPPDPQPPADEDGDEEESS